MINKIDLGIRIGNLRRKLGYSQAELSEILNVTPQSVSKWETGLSVPDIDILLNMSWIFKTTINNILEGDGQMQDIAGVERALLFINDYLLCPECKQKLSISKVNENNLVFQCNKGHQYSLIDGVIDFKTREIVGEQWSLSYRNYDAYLHEHHGTANSNYSRGLNQSDVVWNEIEKFRPKVILDMACGTGQGIKHIIKKINWPVTIIMVDISHRILKWDKIFYSTKWKNPFVDMVYLACDGANLPIQNECVDLVFSNAGYESMQDKMLDGYRESYRVLKNNGCSVYSKSAIESEEDSNSKQWMNLLLSSVNEDEAKWLKEQFKDIDKWFDIMKEIGFTENTYTKIYGELPAPDTATFPFENEIAQWMATFVVTSQKAKQNE